MSESQEQTLQQRGLSIEPGRLIDVFQAQHGGPEPWVAITDQVMGGISSARIEQCERGGSPCVRLTGRTSLKNNGGFVQMKLDIGPAPALANFRGVFFELHGPVHEYDLRIKTTQLDKPWQSFRHGLEVSPQWTRFHVSYADFIAHRTDARLDPTQIRSLAVVAIGEVFDVDVCVRRAGFFT